MPWLAPVTIAVCLVVITVPFARTGPQSAAAARMVMGESRHRCPAAAFS
jgi:hypothetical protein